jgi:hypothetical protein
MNYKINPNLTTRIIEGELVLLNVNKGDFYSLNETGKIIFENIKNNKNKNEIIQELNKNYTISNSDSLENDIDEIITDFINENIILS